MPKGKLGLSDCAIACHCHLFGLPRLTSFSRLPKQFNTTSDQTESDRIAENVEASIANAGAAVPPTIEVKSTPLPEIPSSTEAPALSASTNGIHVETPVNGASDHNTGIAPDANGDKVEEYVTQLAAAASVDVTEPNAPTSGATSFAESVIPSSIPNEAQSTLATEATESVVDTLPDPIPQQPTSDLRSSPHADALTPSQVAEVEAQKHAADNAAATETSIPQEAAPTTTAAPIEEPAPVVEQVAPVSAVEELSKVETTGLATPPAQTPPIITQQPAEVHDTMTEDQPVAPVAASQEIVTEPAPMSVESVPAPIETAPASESQQDEVMTDAPPAKLAREREDEDIDSEPAAKRMKTDDAPTTFRVPDAPTTVSSSPAPTSSAPPADAQSNSDDSVTPLRLSHMKKIISNLKKSNASQAFRQPVDYVTLKIPTYPEVVKNPMDLSKIDHKLKNNAYTSIATFQQDFNQIVINCELFNGTEHAVTQAAYKMRASFNNQMQHLPKVSISEPSKEERKAAKLKQEPTRTAPPRRPSVSTSAGAPQGSARSPKPATPASTTFATHPDGTPLIRRDSVMADGRPKRQIIPPKRNQEFGGRPKKKKYELQLRFCQEVLKEIMSPKNWQANQYFTHPVDPVALNIPTYFQIIKKPMDLSTIQSKLDGNAYEKAKDFEEDVRLIFKNCFKFNPEGDWVNQAGHNLEDIFNRKWATKDDWIASREPQSEPQSDVEEEEESAEESEDDAEDSEAERNDKIAALQKQIAEMSKQMGELTQSKSKKKKSKSPNVPSGSKKSKSKSKKEKPKAAAFPGLQKAEKKKSSAPKPKSESRKIVTFSEKQYISNGIAMLPDKQMGEALAIIQASVPALQNGNESEVELDIEVVPNNALVKLLSLVKRFAGPPPEETRAEETYVAPAAPPKTKKSKPMSKAQQEAQIDELRGKLNQYAGGPSSPGAMQSIENDESSENDSDEESEED
jgi:bromodomain-containing factor 1